MLFSTPRSIPQESIHPLRGADLPTHADISRMSVEEINRSWDSVKAVLARG